MASKNVLELDEETSPALTDLVYIAFRSGIGTFADRKVVLSTLKKYSRTSKTSVKTGNYSIPSSQCDKRWISNRDATGTVNLYLPLAEDGKEIGFMLEAGQKIKIIPNAADTIFLISTTAGEAIESSTLGNTIYLRGTVSGWHVVSQEGTWTISV